MQQQEDRLWERIRKWLKDDSLPEVVLVFGLKKNDFGQWKVNWKASHWLEEEEGIIPKGVEMAISEEMARNKIGDKAFELTREAVIRAPEIISTVRKIMIDRRR